MMNLGRRYLITSIAVALSLCIGQVLGNMFLIALILAAFVALIFLGNSQNFTFPLMLFFLPWSPLLRPNPNTVSFYTISLVIVCAMGLVKGRNRFKKYHIVVGILLALLTLLSKLISGYSLTLAYICFMMLIVLFPLLREEEKKSRYSFYETVFFFAMGIISAALCAQRAASFNNVAKYIRVDSYLTIVRRCGFYGDPNFYVAHITAALAGCLDLILQRRQRENSLVLGVLAIMLIYCGLLSGSKSFVLITALIIMLWLVDLLQIQGQLRKKLAVIICGGLAVVFIGRSAVVKSLIDVLVTRFSMATDMSGFTTGRTKLWVIYCNKLLSDIKVLLVGEGFTSVTVNNGRSSHNTLLQMLYQFGILGTPLIIAWVGYYFGTVFKNKNSRKNMLRKIVLLVGVFLPWMALDMLFFDEFFLMQWFCILGFQEIGAESVVKSCRK